MARLHYNLLRSYLLNDIDDNDLTIDLTEAFSEGGVNIPSFSSPDTMDVTIDREILTVTAYTTGDTTAIPVLRGQGDTLEDSHAAGAPIRNTMVKEDLEIPTGFAILIAADDSSDADKAAADYICDGVADDVQYQAAYDSLDNTLGGTIALAPGHYTFADDPVCANAPVQWLGLGAAVKDDYPLVQINRDGTVANFPLFTVSSGKPTVFENIGLFDNGVDANTSPLIAVTTLGGDVRISRCTLDNEQAAGKCISATVGLNLELEECLIQGDGDCISAASVQVRLNAVLTYFYSYSENSLDLTSLAAGSDIRIYNCQDDGVGAVGYRIDGNTGSLPMPRVVIQGGRCQGDTDENIYVTDIDQLWITDIDLSGGSHGIRASNVDKGFISNLNFGGNGGHGIWLLDCDDVEVSDCYVHAGTNSNNTYSGVLLDGDTNRCRIINNRVRSPSGNKLLYGIRIDDSTCDDNLVEGNDLLGATNTNGNEFSDAGTGTRGWLERELHFFAGGVTAALASNRRQRFTRPAILGLTYLNIVTAPTGQAILVDVDKNGTTIYTTQASRPTIAASGTAGQSVALPDVTYIAAGDYLDTTVDQVGSGTAGSNLVVLQRYMPI